MNGMLSQLCGCLGREFSDWGGCVKRKTSTSSAFIISQGSWPKQSQLDVGRILRGLYNCGWVIVMYFTCGKEVSIIALL